MMKRVHIVGSGPRTGTTLLAEAMNASFEIDRFCDHEAPISEDDPPDGEVFLTKNPGDYCIVKWPLAINRDLHVICMVRDPRDSIVSVHGRAPGQYWSNLRFWKMFMRSFHDLQGNPRFIVVRYEDLAREPDHVQAMLRRRLPFLREKGRFSDFHNAARPGEDSLAALRQLRPISTESIGRWREHLPRVKEQIATHGPISQDLILFGYEPDTAWESCLASVDPVAYGSFLRERGTWRAKLRRELRQLRAIANAVVGRLGLRSVRVFAPFDIAVAALVRCIRIFRKALS